MNYSSDLSVKIDSGYFYAYFWKALVLLPSLIRYKVAASDEIMFKMVHQWKELKNSILRQ